MAEFLDLPTLIVIGLAIVILLRLRSVLGTRTGNERPPSDRIRPPAPNGRDGEETVVPLRPRPAEPANDLEAERRARKLEAEFETFSHGDEALRGNLKALSEAEPAFTPKSFLEGAKMAYEMIVTAFAAGDRKTLKSLLDKEVFEGFDRAIAEREAAGQSVDFTFVGLPKIEITDAEVDKRTASVTVHFDAEVVSATRDAAGELVEGHPEQVMTISDEWTFARPLKARDPNWKLVATNQLG